jgi:hypothetical protein
MPTILKKSGFSVRIYLNDHEPAHVHVIKADGEARIKIKNEDGEPEWLSVSQKMSDKDANRALEIVKEHQSELLEQWWKYHDNAR